MDAIASLIITCILISIAILQILVALGKPYGAFVWGGKHKVLPVRLRIASLFSVVLYAIFSIYALSGADYITLPSVLNTEIMLWVLAGYMTLGIVLNALSRSKPERYTMTPLLLIMALCYYYLALQY